MPVPTRKPVLVLDSSKVNSVNVSFSLAPAKLYIDKYTLFISNEEGKLLRIHNVSKDYNITLVLVPGPRPKIGPSRHIEGNLMSNIPNESSGPEDFRSASNFFGSRVENGLKGAYCSEPPAT